MKTKGILDRLECVSGNGPQYMARCPAHNDRTPSLSIREETDKTLLFCHAGCLIKDILGAMGLKMSDLYKSN